MKFFWFLSIIFVPVVLLQGQDVNAVIAKARKNLAVNDSLLEGVRTLEFRGVIFDGSDERIGSLRLRFKKPNFQRLEVVRDDITEVTAVNAFEGFSQMFNAEGRSVNLRVLTSGQVKQLQLNAHENMTFYKGPQQHRNGMIELIDTVTIDDSKAYVLRFSYNNEQFYYDRYFEVATGELLLTKSGSNGLELKEKGSLVEAGIQFPSEVLTYQDGELIRRVVFDKIIVNHKIDASIFDFPTQY